MKRIIVKISLSFTILCLLVIFSFGQDNAEKEKECSVKLDVEYLDLGYIGKILPVSNSCEKESLEKKAIEKAKKLEFVVAIKNNEPITINKIVEFKYRIIENDKTELISIIEPIIILEKPKASYPNPYGGTICMSGVVRLRVVFLETGQIGNVQAISSLPYGATENAIEVAKKMKFIPMKINGVDTSITKTVTYNFGIY